ncbi:MAG: 23S rRNA (adenine(2503)-C(2))-methyltransferase RlmN [Candidatus Kapaibacterium sp.]
MNTTSIEPLHLKNLSLTELTEIVKALGEPSYRAKQCYAALYNPEIRSFADMTTLPQALRKKLDEHYRLFSMDIANVQLSEDGTRKYLFQLADGKAVEAVLIPSELVTSAGEPKRLTLCVSSQVGCQLGCKFCATASLKLKRNLTVAEIIDQYMLVQQQSDKPITNMVFMGMGEPMLNYDNVMKAIDMFTHPDFKLIGARHITVSTAGVLPGIQRMADENRPVKLAISLHATTNALREKLMPLSKTFTLKKLGDAAEYYYRKTRKPITYEYILFDGLNDSEHDVERLARITRRVPSKVNVIPFHPIEFTHPEGFAAELQATSKENFQRFIAKLKHAGVTVMIRSSSGEDIDAACGQLAFSKVAEQHAAAVSL